MSKRKPEFNETLRGWYMECYPKDDLAKCMEAGTTFSDLFDALDCYKDVYMLIGVGGSIIRERLFQGLADCIGKDYGYVYDQWLMSA